MAGAIVRPFRELVTARTKVRSRGRWGYSPGVKTLDYALGRFMAETFMRLDVGCGSFVACARFKPWKHPSASCARRGVASLRLSHEPHAPPLPPMFACLIDSVHGAECPTATAAHSHHREIKRQRRFVKWIAAATSTAWLSKIEKELPHVERSGFRKPLNGGQQLHTLNLQLKAETAWQRESSAKLEAVACLIPEGNMETSVDQSPSGCTLQRRCGPRPRSSRPELKSLIFSKDRPRSHGLRCMRLASGARRRGDEAEGRRSA